MLVLSHLILLLSCLYEILEMSHPRVFFYFECSKFKVALFCNFLNILDFYSAKIK